MFIALLYRDMNGVRADFYRRAKELGYRLATYVSSRAFVWRNAKLGDNCFVFENNVVQPFVEIGADTILWSGNHVGHHSRIGCHCFLASHVVISGFVTTGDYCFFGVNASVSDKIKIGNRCLVGANTFIAKDAPDGRLFKGVRTEPDAKRSSDDIEI
jgi:sugar O-acyltransferase (sialic acid O-acetyltransferase NeuD family)